MIREAEMAADGASMSKRGPGEEVQLPDRERQCQILLVAFLNIYLRDFMFSNPGWLGNLV